MKRESIRSKEDALDELVRTSAIMRVPQLTAIPIPPICVEPDADKFLVVVGASLS